MLRDLRIVGSLIVSNSARRLKRMSQNKHHLSDCGATAFYLRARLHTSVLALLLIWITGLPSVARSETRVVFDFAGQQREVRGQVLVEAEDGGLLVEGKDTQIWPIQPAQLKQRTDDEIPFSHCLREELAAGLVEEFGDGFQIHDTAHYVICYNTTKAYAQWCGALYERLHRAFHNYWQRRGFKLAESTPLVAIVFQDRTGFQNYARTEMGSAAGSIIGFYSLQTNRITTYDLTGVDELRGRSRQYTTSRHVNELLSRPEAERLVATVIHEATHQLAFNSGLQTRFADIPVWLSEGLAIYFETPDLQTSKGWRTVGALNRVRLRQMGRYLADRPTDSLESLLVTDQRFRDPRSTEAAYAEAWALCHYLMKKRPKEFVAYLKILQRKPTLGSDEPEQRLLDFQRAFGDDLKAIDTELLKHVTELL
jgi:hypothetical protein